MDDIVQGATGIPRRPSRHRRRIDDDPIHKIGIIGAGQMGSGIAHVIALSGYDVPLSDIAKDKVDAAIGTIDKNLARQVASGKISEDDKRKALARITYAETYGRPGRRRSRDRGRDRGRDGQAQDLRGAVSLPQAECHRLHQHLVDLDHAACRRHRPA